MGLGLGLSILTVLAARLDPKVISSNTILNTFFCSKDKHVAAEVNDLVHMYSVLGSICASNTQLSFLFVTPKAKGEAIASSNHPH